MSPSQKMSTLFDAIDTSGAGSLTESQFSKAFQTHNPPASFQAIGASGVWSHIDPSGSATVSKQDFVSAMTGLMKELRGQGFSLSSSAAGASALSAGTQALDALGGAAQPPADASSSFQAFA